MCYCLAHVAGRVWLVQVILEEFGKFINLTVGADMAQRNQFYGIIFDEINVQNQAGKPIQVSWHIELAQAPLRAYLSLNCEVSSAYV